MVSTRPPVCSAEYHGDGPRWGTGVGVWDMIRLALDWWCEETGDAP